MPQGVTSVRFTNDPILPIQEHRALSLPVNLVPGVTLVAGQVIAQLTGSANDVQTFTCTGTPTGGSFTFIVTNPLTGAASNLVIPYNCSATTLQTLANAIFGGIGSNNVTAGGGPWPGTALTLTGAGALANVPIPVATASTNALTGGSSPNASVAHTTTGQTANTFAAYNSAVAAPPVAPAVSGTSSGSAFAAGTYLVQVTVVNAQGETTPSPEAPVTLTAGQKINVASMSGLDASATGLNVYVDGSLVGQAAVSGGTSTATAFDAASVTTKGEAPSVNTAYTIPNGAGSQNARAVLKYTCTTDASGRITYGSVPTGQTFPNVGGFFGEQKAEAPAYFGGDFYASQLTGLDATAISQVGRVLIGTTAAPVVVRLS